GNLCRGVDPAQGQGQVSSDLLETGAPEQLNGPGHAVERHILAHELTADAGGYHSSGDSEAAVSIELPKDLFKIVLLQRDIRIDVPDKLIIDALGFAQPPIKRRNF